MKLLTGDSTWAVTDWTSSIATQVTASLLAKYSDINGIISDYGTDVLAALNAFQAAHRSLPAVAVPDANGLGCLWQKDHSPQSQFQMITDSTRNWMGRVACPQGHRRGGRHLRHRAQPVQPHPVRELDGWAGTSLRRQPASRPVPLRPAQPGRDRQVRQDQLARATMTAPVALDHPPADAHHQELPRGQRAPGRHSRGARR